MGALVIGVFLLETISPTGIALSALYVFAVLGAAWIAWKWAPHFVAAGCTVLTLAGLAIGPPGHPDDAASRLIIALVVLWAAASASVRLAKAGEATARLAELVKTSEDAIIGQSIDGVIESWNGGAERIFGFVPDEGCGRARRRALKI